MHVVFEGVLPHHLKFLLKYCVVDQGFFTLQYLNTEMSTFSYGYTEAANAPRSLDRDRIISRDQKIVQSGDILCGYNVQYSTYACT